MDRFRPQLINGRVVDFGIGDLSRVEATKLGLRLIRAANLLDSEVEALAKEIFDWREVRDHAAAEGA